MRIIIISIYIGVLHAHTRAAGGIPRPDDGNAGSRRFRQTKNTPRRCASCRSSPPRRQPTRLRNRDSIDGRPRAYNRKFGLSRINLREKAHKGELPGVVKSSW